MWAGRPYPTGTALTGSGEAMERARRLLSTKKPIRAAFAAEREKKKRPRKCPVCRGSCFVTVSPPAIPCAYCRGKGMERRTGRLCTVCRGKGIVSVHLPIALCGDCRGSGAEQGTGMTCLKCSGKGVVHVMEMPRTGSNGGNGGRN